LKFLIDNALSPQVADGLRRQHPLSLRESGEAARGEPKASGDWNGCGPAVHGRRVGSSRLSY
jgi:hypothetical protein